MPPAIIAGAAVIGAAATVYSAVKSGNDQSDYYSAVAASNHAQADEDLKVAGQNISAVQDDASLESAQLFRQGKQVEGTQRAVMGSEGIASDSATASDISNDTFNKENLDQMLVRYNANRKTQAIAEQANFAAGQLRSSSSQYLQAGSNAVVAGDLKGGASLLGGAAQVGSYWNKMYAGGGGAGATGGWAGADAGVGNSYV